MCITKNSLNVCVPRGTNTKVHENVTLSEAKLLLRIKVSMNFNEPQNAMLDEDEQRKLFFACTLSKRK